jgi:hypothetical protein
VFWSPASAKTPFFPPSSGGGGGPGFRAGGVALIGVALIGVALIPFFAAHLYVVVCIHVFVQGTLARG